MKLLSVHLHGHDSNLSYFDGQKVHYLKAERLYQKKHLELASINDFQKILKDVFNSCPILLNTSLNVSGNPIAGYIQNAIDEFNSKDIDVLVVGNNITTK
jgi:predicted NodU family carbamoyl transferase